MSIESHALAQTTPTGDSLVERDTVNGIETASTNAIATAMSAQAIAQIQAQHAIARRFPRDPDRVRQLMLRECKRTGFAEAAWYRKPIGQGVEGFSIRFAEAAQRLSGNMQTDTIPLTDDADKRTLLVRTIDFETNATYVTSIVVTKTVERSRPDGQVLSQRRNSRGGVTYVVRATDDDILNKQNALVSKAIRTNILRLIPGDVLDECKVEIRKTMNSDVTNDPDAARKKIVDAFDTIGVLADELSAYLNHPLAQASPAEIIELRAVYQSIHDSDATWPECLAASPHRPKPEGEAKPDERTTAVRAKVQGRVERLRERGKPGDKGKTKSTSDAHTAPARGEPREDDGSLTPEQERANFPQD